MRLKRNFDTIAFLQRVKQCSGDVIYKTGEGDILNLKSTLSCYVFSMANSSEEIEKQSWIECDEEEDYAVLGEFLAE